MFEMAIPISLFVVFIDEQLLPSIQQNNPTFSEKTPLFFEKAPMFSEKSPMFFEKSGIVRKVYRTFLTIS